MQKILLIGIITMLLISGCAVSDYIKGTDDKPYSLVDEEDSGVDDGVDELDDIIRELEEEPGEELNKTIDEVEEEVVDEEIENVTEEAPIVIQVQESETISLKPTAKDADDDVISYTFSEPLDKEGKWETDFGDAGEYLIKVTASDGKLETSRQVLLIVERLNVAPEISEVPDTITVEEGDTLTLEPEVEDPNGDEVELTISDPVGDDGEWVIGYQEAGSYDIEVMATDGELETVLTVMVTVKRKNVAPKISGLEDLEIDEGETVIIEPEITDLNGDEVTVTISDPVGDDGIWETEFTDHGTYTIVVEADDGEKAVTEEITLTVNDINIAPVIENITQE